MLALTEADDSQEYLVALAERDDKDFVLQLIAAVRRVRPGARLCLVTYPLDMAGTPFRLLLGAMAAALGLPPLTRQDRTGSLAMGLPLKLQRAYDVLIVDNADAIDEVGLNFLRRDQGICPAILVGRSHLLLDHLKKDEMLMGRSLLLTPGSAETEDWPE